MILYQHINYPLPTHKRSTKKSTLTSQLSLAPRHRTDRCHVIVGPPRHHVDRHVSPRQSYELCHVIRTDMLMWHCTQFATSSCTDTSSNPLPTHNYVLVNTFTYQKLPTHRSPLPTHIYVLVIIITNT